jgi:hypothetical protein
MGLKKAELIEKTLFNRINYKVFLFIYKFNISNFLNQ